MTSNMQSFPRRKNFWFVIIISKHRHKMRNYMYFFRKYLLRCRFLTIRTTNCSINNKQKSRCKRQRYSKRLLDHRWIYYMTNCFTLILQDTNLEVSNNNSWQKMSPKLTKFRNRTFKLHNTNFYNTWCNKYTVQNFKLQSLRALT